MSRRPQAASCAGVHARLNKECSAMVCTLGLPCSSARAHSTSSHAAPRGSGSLPAQRVSAAWALAHAGAAR